jgi:hypothetical protein
MNRNAMLRCRTHKIKRCTVPVQYSNSLSMPNIQIAKLYTFVIFDFIFFILHPPPPPSPSVFLYIYLAHLLFNIITMSTKRTFSSSNGPAANAAAAGVDINADAPLADSKRFKRRYVFSSNVIPLILCAP